LLLLRLLQHVVPQLLARRTRVADHALCIRARRIDRLLLLGEQQRGLVTVPLCRRDRLLERFLARPTAAVSGLNANRARTKRRTTKMMSVQNITPAFGDRRSTFSPSCARSGDALSARKAEASRERIGRV
jgi:hypothetical protein